MAIKYVDQNSLIYIFTKIKDNFVQKEAGKGLSTNDYTTTEKEKLAAIAAGAQVNVLEGVQVNGTDLTISGKKVNIVVPTKISDLGAITESDLDAALAEKVNAAAEGNHSHANKTVLDGISTEKVAAWDDAASKAHEHSNKSVLDGITSVKVSAWDAAEQNAKTYADGLADNYDAKGAASAAETAAKAHADSLNTAMDTRVVAVEGKAHEHSNKTILDGITTEKVAAWDAAESNAKTYADGLNTAMDTRVDALEAAIGEGGSVQDKIDASIEALDLANTYEAKGAAAAVQTSLAGDISDLTDRVAANETAITTLNGNSSVEGSVDKKVADAINAFATQVTDDGTINTYKEALDYIATHGSEYTALVGSVDANTKAIETIETTYMKTADMVALTNSEIDEAFANA